MRRSPRRDLPAGRRRRRRSPLRAGLLLCLGLLLLGVAFFAGLAVGRAVEDAPEPGGTQTFVRTLEPRTLTPEPETVTVTTGS